MATDYETILVDFDRGVTTITLNRPEQRNAINLDDGAGALRGDPGRGRRRRGARDRRHRRGQRILQWCGRRRRLRVRSGCPCRTRRRARRHLGHHLGARRLLAFEDADHRCDQRPRDRRGDDAPDAVRHPLRRRGRQALVRLHATRHRARSELHVAPAAAHRLVEGSRPLVVRAPVQRARRRRVGTWRHRRFPPIKCCPPRSSSRTTSPTTPRPCPWRSRSS